MIFTKAEGEEQIIDCGPHSLAPVTAIFKTASKTMFLDGFIVRSEAGLAAYASGKDNYFPPLKNL